MPCEKQSAVTSLSESCRTRHNTVHFEERRVYRHRQRGGDGYRTNSGVEREGSIYGKVAEPDLVQGTRQSQRAGISVAQVAAKNSERARTQSGGISKVQYALRKGGATGIRVHARERPSACPLLEDRGFRHAAIVGDGNSDLRGSAGRTLQGQRLEACAGGGDSAREHESPPARLIKHTATSEAASPFRVGDREYGKIIDAMFVA